MENKKGLFYGSIKSFDEDKKTVTADILHYGVANENMWLSKPGAFDSFLARLEKANKHIAAYYQHDDKLLIGKWVVTSDNIKLSGTLYLSDTPFVRDTVIPQLKDGTLQGASPHCGPRELYFDKIANVDEIIEGVISEISLVGLPADLEANLTHIAAKIEARKTEAENFEIDVLTL